MWYNYIYLDPRKPGRYTYEGLNFSLLFEPFYVGKGHKKRYLAHLSKRNLKEKHYKNHKIKAISESFDIREYIMVFNRCDEHDCVKNYEEFLITTIGRIDLKTGPLTNLTSGGDSNIPGPESREKMKAAKKGKTYEEIFGVEKALEIKIQKSERMSGCKNHFYGKRHSDETLRIIAEKSKGKRSGENHFTKKPDWVYPDEGRKKLSESHKLLVGEKAVKAKFYRIVSPSGEVYIFAGGYNQKCIALGIKSPQYLRDTALGKRSDYKGWKMQYLTKEEYFELKNNHMGKGIIEARNII